MNLIKSSNCDVNYLSKVVKINEFTPHPNPEVQKLKCCKVDGYNIIVGIDSKPGLYIFFPQLSQINSDFLRFANLYNNKTLNADPEKKGMFNSNGRVTTIKLKPIYKDNEHTIVEPGCISEGFLLEADVFGNYLLDSFNKTVEFIEGTEFDTIEHNGKTCWISKKYVAQVRNRRSTPTNKSRDAKELQQTRKSKIIDNQFRFHYDTVIIKKCPNVIQPDDIISITHKIHGTSHISSYVLCEQQNVDKWTKYFIWFKNNIINKIYDIFGITYKEISISPKYDYLYASRKRILNEYANAGWYGVDVWSYAHKYLQPYLEKGMTIYAEIVGFLPTGGYIQKNYDYGCVSPSENSEYVPELHFKVRPYRITLTNIDGVVHEFSALEVQQWCRNNGLIPVTECYYGYAKDLYPDLVQDENWNNNFIERLSNDKNFYMEQLSPDCNNSVYHEGVVIKTEKMRSEAWKLKCFAFINGEQKALDANESNIEDEA